MVLGLLGQPLSPLVALASQVHPYVEWSTAAFPVVPVTWLGEWPLLVLGIVALPAVLRARRALCRPACQIDVVPNHCLPYDAAVWLGGWNCEGKRAQERREWHGDSHCPPQ